MLRADVAVRPDPSAARAENTVASGARHSGGLGLVAGLHTAHCLALQHRAPGFTGVQLHFCRDKRAQLELLVWCSFSAKVLFGFVSFF